MRLPRLMVVVAVGGAAMPGLAGAQGFNPFSSSAQSVQSSQVGSSVTLIILAGGVLGGAGGAITTTVNRNENKAAAARGSPPPTQPPPAAAPEPFVPAPFPEPLPPAPVEPSAPPPPPGVLRDTERTFNAMLAARAWLRANDVQLKQDLALGAGPALEDLAEFARIAPARRAHFAQVLRRNRAQLISPRDPTPHQAAALMGRVGELLWADPQLRVDAQGALAGL